MKHVTTLISTMLFCCLLLGQTYKVFAPDEHVNKYFKGVAPGKKKLALTTDLVNFTLFKLVNVGAMYSITNAFAVEASYANSFNMKPLVNIAPHYGSSEFTITTRKTNELGLNGYLKLGKLGLTYTTYVGIAYKKSGFSSDFVRTGFYGPNVDGPVKTSSSSLFFVLGSQRPLFLNLQIGWQAGIGSESFKTPDLNNFYVSKNTETHLQGFGQLRLQYLIF